MKTTIFSVLLLIPSLAVGQVTDIVAVDSVFTIKSNDPNTESSDGSVWEVQNHTHKTRLDSNASYFIGQPVNYVPVQATLRFEIDQQRIGTIGAYQLLSNNWNGDDTWNDQNEWSDVGPQLDETSLGATQFFLNLDVTDAVQNWFALGDLQLGVILVGETEGTDYSVTDAEYRIKYELFGDSNSDGKFNSSDLVTVFLAGKYEVDVDADFYEGDWNLDGRFDTSDFVDAFLIGHYEDGVAAMAADWEDLQ